MVSDRTSKPRYSFPIER